VDLAVSEQLALAGLDVVSAHSLDKLGDEDPSHLQRAVEMGRILCIAIPILLFWRKKALNTPELCLGLCSVLR
jgi:hypothetical protein